MNTPNDNAEPVRYCRVPDPTLPVMGTYGDTDFAWRHPNGVFVKHADFLAMRERAEDAERWKREMLEVTSALDLQGIAKELGLKLGETIPDKILPALIARRELAFPFVKACVLTEPTS